MQYGVLPFVLSTLVLAAPVLGAGRAAAEDVERTIVIKDHRFEPATVEVPAGERVKLVIDNQDSTPEEFESLDLRREKVVPANAKATIWISPLTKGEYEFVGEFHEDTAKGKLIAK